MTTSTRNTPTYTIEHPATFDMERFAFVMRIAKEQSELYNLYDWRNFNIYHYVDRGGRVVFVRRNGVLVGAMISRLQPSILDPETKVLVQDLLFAEKGTRAAKMLLDEFIDFGKANANHIVTMIAKNSNIKARSLERLGFQTTDTNFMMEIK